MLGKVLVPAHSANSGRYLTRESYVKRQQAVIKFLGLLMLSVAGMETRAYAGPITYNINFVVGTGFPDATASFNYDSAAAIGSQFSAFNVKWDSFTFDFTAVANATNFNTAGCGTVTSTITFAFLSGTGECPGTNTIYWQAGAPVGGSPAFYFVDSGTTGYILLDASPASGTGDGAFVNNGAFTIAAASQTVPEPSSFLLALTCGAFLVAVRKRLAPITR